jgi:hypothetical protein
MLELRPHFELSQAFPYLDALIHEGVTAWQGLGIRWPTTFPRTPGRSLSDHNLVTNGSFEFEIVNGGLDWRIIPVKGVVVSTDNRTFFDGVRSLRIEFGGKDFHVFQYIPVKPKTLYRFTGYMRVQRVTTDSGPRFQIYDAYDIHRLFLSTGNAVGTSGLVATTARVPNRHRHPSPRSSTRSRTQREIR